MSRPFHRILCAADGSRGAEEALRFAVRLASETNAELHVVHCFQTQLHALPGGVTEIWDSVNDDERERKARQFVAWVESIAPQSPKLHTHFVEGRPADHIPILARELGAELIVAGTHGRTGLARVLLGSKAEGILRTSTVPVLLVPRRPVT